MSINVNSITDSYNAWYDYKYGNNTRGLTADDIAQIETRWKSNLASWKAQAAKDENKYEITDDDFNNAKNNGKNDVKQSTGHNGKADNSGTVASTIGGGVASIGGMGATAYAANEILPMWKKAQSGSSKSHCLWGAVALAGAGGLLYGAARIIRGADPNGDDAKALEELLGTTLPEAQGELMEAQSNMENATEEVAGLTEEANANNEDTNEEIADSKTEFDMYRKAAEILQEKQRNGIALSGFEEDFLKEVTPILEDLSGHISGVTEENTETTQEIYDEIGGYQETFDESAETIAEVEGVTEFAAGFDETTASNTEVMISTAEMGGQGSQTVEFGGIAAIATGAVKMGSLLHQWEGWAMIGLGGAAVASAKGAEIQFSKLQQEQTQYNQIAQAEIQTRGFTQDLNAGTLEAYDEQIAIYDDNTKIVEDLEMYVPDDLEMPDTSTTGAPVAAGSDKSDKAEGDKTGDVSGTDSNSGSDTSDPKKGKKDVK